MRVMYRAQEIAGATWWVGCCPGAAQHSGPHCSLQKHIKEHHEEVRERPCPHPGCNKVFMIDRYLQRHVKLIHTGACPDPLMRTAPRVPILASWVVCCPWAAVLASQLSWSV